MKLHSDIIAYISHEKEGCFKTGFIHNVHNVIGIKHIVEERSHLTDPRRTHFFHIHIWNPESV